MRLKINNATAWLFGGALFVFSGAAMATNGYFTHGVGAQSKAMAGTGIGSNANMGPIISASNPALGVFQGDDWEVGLSIFSPRRSYTASTQSSGGQGGSFSLTPGTIDSSSEFFPIPHVAKNWLLSEDRALTLVFYGRGGMNTDWDDANAGATSFFCGADPNDPNQPGTGPGPYCAGVAGVDLSQAFLAVNYAGKVSDRFSWGIGPVIALQSFEAKGVRSFTPITETFASSIASGGGPVPANSLTDNGHEVTFGFGIAAGIWWGLTDNFSFGLAYQSEISMDEFSDYSDLFAEAGGFDIPSSLKAGVSFVASDALRINLDIEHTTFSDVASIANPMANIGNCFTANQPVFPETSGCLGASSGAGFGWEDMTTYKIGFDWAVSETYSWKFGYSYGEQPIQSADVLFNILAPGVMEQHFTIGLTRQQANGGVLNFGFMYAPEKSVSGPNFFDPFQTITIEMNQFEFEVSYRW